MKRFLIAISLMLTISCSENNPADNDFTGNEVVYALYAGSVYPISGTLTLKEKKDGTTFVVVELSGTEGTIQHPVHLHLGDISAPGAEVAALLNPVKGSTGRSETSLSILSDETPITFEQLVNLNACVKIHLTDTGPERDIILAGGNIGSNSQARVNNNFGVCKSQ